MLKLFLESHSFGRAHPLSLTCAKTAKFQRVTEKRIFKYLSVFHGLLRVYPILHAAMMNDGGSTEKVKTFSKFLESLDTKQTLGLCEISVIKLRSLASVLLRKCAKLLHRGKKREIMTRKSANSSCEIYSPIPPPPSH